MHARARSGGVHPAEDPATLELSVIVVTYNSAGEIGACVSSVAECARAEGLDIEIIVVDNASADDTVDIAQTIVPEAVVVHSGGNLGFSRANNMGIEVARAAHTLILNPDTRMDAGTLTKCLDISMRDARWGIVACRLYNEITIQRSWFWLPTLGTDLLRLIGVLPMWRALRCGVLKPEICPVGGVVGAFMLSPTALLRDVGGFDPEVFMYGEDVDLCYRIARAGYRIGYVPGVSCYHVHNASGRKDPEGLKRRFEKHHDAVRWFYAKHHAPWKYKVFAAAVVVTYPLRRALLGIVRMSKGGAWAEARIMAEQIQVGCAWRDLRGSSAEAGARD